MRVTAALAEARRHGVRLERVGDRLRLVPAGILSPDVVEELRAHRDELLERLCFRCWRLANRVVVAYWGTDQFCPACCAAVAAEHDAKGSWPPVPWTEDAPA